MKIARDLLRRWLYGRRPKRHELVSPTGHLLELQSGLADAEQRLGLKNTARLVSLVCVAGAKKLDGYWGVEHPDGLKAGFCQPLGAGRYIITVYCDPRNIQPRRDVVAHEAAHVLLYEAGVPHQEHHDRMKKAGI